MAPKKRAINPDSVFECEVCGEMFDDLETATEHENACTDDGTLEDDAEEDAETMGQMPEGEGVIKMSLSCDQPDDLVALALLHRGETEEGDDVLFEAGYEYRYSDRALMGGLGTQPKKKKTKKKSKAESKAVQCDHAKIFDDALPQQDLDLMQSVFCAWDKKEDYWVSNKYHDNARFISWAHSLASAPKNGIEQVMWRIRKLAEQQFPERMKDVGTVEWWAHSRPPKSGHWMHFDSANNNAGGRATPCVSTVLFLSEGPFPPTLVTDEFHTAQDTTSDMDPASNAWLVHPKENRLLLFDGTAMHSVIPGDQQANPKAGRRVTFMCVFWPKGGFCASEADKTERRPLPKTGAWAVELGKRAAKRKRKEEPLPDVGPPPEFIGGLWVPVDPDGDNSKGERIPYKKFFQGIANYRE